MSQPSEPRKISADVLYERAWEWWDRLDQSDIEEHITKAYMIEHQITDDQIDW
jgi:hypothetical protein